MKTAFMALILISTIPNSSFAKPSRTVTLNDTEIASIKTAMGYSTILQFDARPSSVVLGDQDAFKVEYVGNSVTIKPLLPSSKSNMFVFTDYDRFNFKIVTASSNEADYIVQVKRKASSGGYQSNFDGNKVIVQDTLKWTTSRGINLKVSSIARPKNRSAFIVAFSVSINSARKPNELKIAPGDIEVTQKGRVVPIDSLYLEREELSVSEPMSHGTLILRGSDYSNGQPLTLNFSAGTGKQVARLRVPIPQFSHSKGGKVDAKESKD